MTVVSNDRRRTYPGNGVANVFTGPKAVLASHIAVYLVDDATQVATLVSTGDYTLAGVGGRRQTTVTMTTPPPTGQTLLILRTVLYEQDADISNQGAYLPEVVELAMDDIVRQTQQLDDQLGFAIRFPETMLDFDPNISGELTPGGPLILGYDLKSVGIGSEIGSGDLLLRGDLASGASGKGASLVTVRDAPDNFAGSTLESVLAELAGRDYLTPEQFGALGDGVTDDTAALQAAFAAAAGKVLRLTPGKTYVMNSGVARIASGTKIIAYGATVKRGSGSTTNRFVTADTDGVTGGYTACTDVTILGGTWDGNYPTITAPLAAFGFCHARRIRIENCYMKNVVAHHYIELNSTADAVVYGCTFEGGAEQSDASMEAVQIDGAISSAVFSGGAPYDNTFCSNIKIIGNTFLNCGSGVGSHSSVSGKRHSIITIANNLFSSSYFCGVRGMNWENAVIVGNVFYGGALGVRMQADASTINEGLVISNNIFWKIGLSNQAGAGSGHAIYLFGNSAGTEQYNHFTINGNVIRDCDQPTSGAGIKVNYCPYGTINGNAIDNLTIGTGIAVFGNGDISIIGNRVKNTSGPSISAQALGSLVVSSNIVDTINYTSITRSLVTNNIVANGGGITSGGTNTDTHTVNNLVGTVYA